MIFADTSALYAVLDRSDAAHGRATTQWIDLLSEPAEPIVVSNYVLVECFALTQSRLGLQATRAFHDTVVPVLDVRWIGADDHRAGAHAVLSAGRRSLSLVDCTSFRIMRRLGITRAFTLDRHFAEQGFELLPPPP